MGVYESEKERECLSEQTRESETCAKASESLGGTNLGMHM